MFERISQEREQVPIIDTLEIASGNFSLVQEMKRVADEQGGQLDFGKNVVISDYHAELLADSREDLRGGQPKQEKILQNEMRLAIDNAKMPFPDDSVRRIICANFFSSESAMNTEYRDGGNSLTTAKRFIDEIHRVLLPEGLLLIHDTLSPEVSDFIFEAGLFNVGFEEVDLKDANLGLTEDFVSKIKNRYGESNVRSVKILRKI